MWVEARWDEMTIVDGMLTVPLSVEPGGDAAVSRDWSEAFERARLIFAGEVSIQPHDQDVTLGSGVVLVAHVREDDPQDVEQARFLVNEMVQRANDRVS